jgi:glycosyltransferase involved in cell wall biosynthesis
LKILFVIDTFTAGGKERRLMELMKSLKLEPDIEFEFALMTYDIHYKEVLDLGINIHYLIRKTKKDISVFFSFYKLCKDFKPDIVHCWDTMTAIYITPICKLLHLKFVNGMVVDSPQKQTLFFKPWLRARLTFPFSDVIIGNSKAGLKAYNAPARKSVVIYNGFNFNRTENILPKQVVREQLNISTKYIIGMVATFSDLKDYPTYFKAAQILIEKRKDITFLAIGKDTDSLPSRNMIDKRNKDYFRLLGKKSDIESFINAMDIGVLSTFTEGISNSILEYMALGKPVIATSGGGTAEIVEDHKTGFLINRSDPDELASKAEKLLNNEDLRLGMGKNGKDRIKEMFSIEIMTSKFISVYEDLILN